MKLPFTMGEFLQLFKEYNQSIFPLQIIFYLLGLSIILLSIRKIRGADIIINSILAFFWLWMGVVYHLLFFSAINKAAYLFGILFILQGMLFFYYGLIKRRLTFKFKTGGVGVIGSILIAFSLIIYPLLGYIFGHIYPASPTFGVPCPTTIFTFGVLLWSERKVPKVVLTVPLLWSIVGFSAATTLGIREDMALVVAGLAATGILLFPRQPQPGF